MEGEASKFIDALELLLDPGYLTMHIIVAHGGECCLHLKPSLDRACLEIVNVLLCEPFLLE